MIKPLNDYILVEVREEKQDIGKVIIMEEKTVIKFILVDGPDALSDVINKEIAIKVGMLTPIELTDGSRFLMGDQRAILGVYDA